MAVCDTFRDTEVDGDTCASTCVLDCTDILSVWLDDNAFFGVFGQGTDLFQRWVAFGPILEVISD